LKVYRRREARCFRESEKGYEVRPISGWLLEKICLLGEDEDVRRCAQAVCGALKKPRLGGLHDPGRPVLHTMKANIEDRWFIGYHGV
jgi:hypothetical protein